MDCIFCRIVNKEIPADIVYEDDQVICFNDIAPQAPVHVLIVPKRHVDNILGCAQDTEILVDIAKAVYKVTEKLNLQEDGFRTIINTGANGGQTVNHLHWHIIGGIKLGEGMV